MKSRFEIVRMSTRNVKKKLPSTEIIHQECAPCDGLRHWLRTIACDEDVKQDMVFLVGEIARSEFVKILKSSRRFEYRLSNLIREAVIVPSK